jgi:hypothetical protein
MQQACNLFLTKHLIMAPLIWRLIINLSRSVAEVSGATYVVCLYVTHTCIPVPRLKKTRKLNFLMLKNTCLLF